MVAPSGSGPFAALLILSCTPETADRLLGEVRTLAEKNLPLEPGFVSCSVYIGEERSQVVALTTWKERKFFQAFHLKDDTRTHLIRGLEYHPKIHFLRLVTESTP